MTCTCGHDVLVHTLTPKQVRTWCTTWPLGERPCPCQTFTEEKKP